MSAAWLLDGLDEERRVPGGPREVEEWLGEAVVVEREGRGTLDFPQTTDTEQITARTDNNHT